MKRVLVVYWSQTGQVQEAITRLVEPIGDAGHVVQRAEIVPRAPWPFPWTVARFMGAFPETVLERPAPIEPVTTAGAWDLVVLAGPAWFLSPSQPMTAFLQSDEARALAGAPALVLVSSRNMWTRCAARTEAMARAAGMRPVGRVVVTHAGRVMASYFTTLAWLLTGRRDALRPLGRAEIQAAAYAPVAAAGAQVARALDAGVIDAVEASPAFSYPHALGEQIGGALYPWLARAAAVTAPGSRPRAGVAWVLLFAVLGLVFGLAIPCFGLHLLAPGTVRRWVDRRVGIGRHGAERGPMSRVPASR